MCFQQMRAQRKLPTSIMNSQYMVQLAAEITVRLVIVYTKCHINVYDNLPFICKRLKSDCLCRASVNMACVLGVANDCGELIQKRAGTILFAIILRSKPSSNLGSSKLSPAQVRQIQVISIRWFKLRTHSGKLCYNLILAVDVVPRNSTSIDPAVLTPPQELPPCWLSRIGYTHLDAEG